MMYSIDVLGAFGFAGKEVPVGRLEYERLKGSPSYRFAYDPTFLAEFPGISLSADLGLFRGTQSASGGIFAMLSDALPDRWGRALMDKRERNLALKEGRVPRTFDDFGYLVRIDDATRMGALRFRYGGKYLGTDAPASETVPPLASLGKFIQSAREIEEAERLGAPFVREDLLYSVWKHGSSLGGARPKVNISDGGELWIAKIPSVGDEYDMGMWEHFACTLARKAGIDAAETRLVKTGSTPYHTLLSKRFDREGSARIHYASALTMTGFHDGDGADTGRGYPDMADAMSGAVGLHRLQANLEELYRRVAFYIMVGNHDDHFRNHGFLLGPDGWRLSPAFDINPTNQFTQSLLIAPNSDRSSLKDLLGAAGYYLLDEFRAREIVRSVVSAVRGWREHAASVGIPRAESERFAARFESSLSEARVCICSEKGSGFSSKRGPVPRRVQR